MRHKQNALNLIQLYGLGKRTFYDATRLLISENHKSNIFMLIIWFIASVKLLKSIFYRTRQMLEFNEVRKIN